jgi:hypothetical protein
MGALCDVCHGRRFIAMLRKVFLCRIQHPTARDESTRLRTPRTYAQRRGTLSGHFAILSGPGFRRKRGEGAQGTGPQ